MIEQKQNNPIRRLGHFLLEVAKDGSAEAKVQPVTHYILGGYESDDEVDTATMFNQATLTRLADILSKQPRDDWWVPIARGISTLLLIGENRHNLRP